MHISPALPPQLLLGRPRRLAWLMELYERNYRQLAQLLGGWQMQGDTATSHSPSDFPLHLTVIERGPYTLELRLTYHFEEGQTLKFMPDCFIKLYHDAGVAEAVQLTGRPPWLAGRDEFNEAQAYLDAQWQRNMLLNKWLEYLLHHGHGFAHVTSTA